MVQCCGREREGKGKVEENAVPIWCLLKVLFISLKKRDERRKGGRKK